MELTAIYENSKTYSVYLSVFAEAKEILDSIGENTDVDFLTSCRNRILASELGSDKANFFGTLSTEPVATVDELVSRGTQLEPAAQLIAGRDYVRASLLALMPVGVTE